MATVRVRPWPCLSGASNGTRFGPASVINESACKHLDGKTRKIDSKKRDTVEGEEAAAELSLVPGLSETLSLASRLDRRAQPLSSYKICKALKQHHESSPFRYQVTCSVILKVQQTFSPSRWPHVGQH